MVHIIGLIRVITLIDEHMLNIHGRIIERAFPELKVISKCIEGFPKGLYNRESMEMAKPEILRLAREFEKQGVEAIIISCTADPAVLEARKELKIPVIGAGSAAASISLALGERIGVLNLTEETPEVIKRILKDHLVKEVAPKGVWNTLDLLTYWGKEAAKEALKTLIESRVNVIMLGCTGYSTIGFARVAEELFKVSIVDPVMAAGAVTLSILKQKEVSLNF
ncbi:MAG: aspartate/glutamate racemase family protein [Candidatus Methanomethylicia archaeon]|nr:aspartate/glutamate racemase family protein [Candidatus Methanomethylicia archaeon]